MLTVRDLVVKYDQLTVLKGISLEVKAGQIVTLIGANGAGKTTLLRAISGLHRPSSGSIVFKDREILKLQPFEITGAGIVHVPEGRMLLENMTVRENLLAGAFTRNDKDGIQSDIADVEHRFPVLRERAGQKAGTLSGGERQMLAIGRALMARPQLLMLDEPSLGLAPKIVQFVFETISELGKEGTTILLVEQNAYGALGISDYAYALRVGAIGLEDRASKLLENKKFVDAYLGEA